MSSNTIGGFKIIRKISQGSQSVTYLATPPPEHAATLPAQVALKRIASNVLRPADISVFLKLRHPGLVPCFAALQHEDQVVLVTPYYEGGDLEHFISSMAKAKKPLDSDTVTRWMVQLIRALQYCHENKVIHRDLRLSNVFLSKDHSKVLLGGFGLARALDKSNNTGSMMSTMSAGGGNSATLVGSPVNLSPEVISGQPYSFSSDAWSLGCLVYELLAFEKPFNSASFAQVVLKVCNGQYDPLPAATVPKPLRNAVSGMLQVDPKQRWLLTEVLESDDSFALELERQQQQQSQDGASATAGAAGGGGGGGRKPPISAGTGAVASNEPAASSSSSSRAKNAATDSKETAAAAAAAAQQHRRPSSRSVSPSAAAGGGGGGRGDGSRRGSIKQQQQQLQQQQQSSSGGEDLDEWVRWKNREFAQIDAVLKKIGGDDTSAAAEKRPSLAQALSGLPLAPPSSSAAAAGKGGKKQQHPAAAAATAAAAGRVSSSTPVTPPSAAADPFYDPETPPPGVPSSLSAAALKNNNNQPAAGGKKLDAKRAQRMLPSPRAGKVAGAADNAPQTLPPPPPPHGRRAGGGGGGGGAVPAAQGGGGGAANSQQQHFQFQNVANNNNNNHDKASAAAEQGEKAKASAAAAASAEKRNAQRAELQRRIAEGRKAHHAAAGGGGGAGGGGEDVVISTPSRPLNMNQGAGESPARQKHQHRDNNMFPAAAVPAPSPPTSAENKTPDRPSIRDEIAKRRAEIKASPVVAPVGKDGPALQILLQKQ